LNLEKLMKPKSQKTTKPESVQPKFVKNFSWIAVSITILLGFLIYSNSFDAEMQFDDILQIEVKTRVNDISQFASISEWTNINMRPLAYFTFAINYYFGEYNVLGYHIFNFVIHLLSAIFVFFLAKMIFMSASGKKTYENIRFYNIAALFAALLFVSHPIQTQGVTYIVQRMTSLSAMFYILSILLYAVGRKNHISGKLSKAYFLYFITFVSALFSLLSKQIAITIPLTILFYEFFFVRNGDGKPFNKYLIYASIPIIAAILFAIFAGLIPKETDSISRIDYLITQSRVIVKYFQLLIFPIQLNVDYYFEVSHTIWGWKEILSIIFILALLSLAIVFRKKEPVFSFGVIWIFLTLSVESSIIPIRDVIFEHRLYLPMFGFALTVSVLFLKYFFRKKMQFQIVFLSIIIILLSVKTYSRNKVWQNQHSLWIDITEKSPNKPRPFHNLAKIYLDDKNYAAALKNAERAAYLNPENGHAFYIIGVCHEQTGDTTLAIFNYKRAIRFDDKATRAMNNFGSILMKQGEYRLAIRQFLMAHEIERKNMSVLQNLCVSFYKIGDFENAIKFNNKRLRIAPNNAVFLSSLGLSHLRLKQFDLAIEAFTKAIEKKPNLINPYIDMGTCYFYKEDYEKAYDFYSQALKIDPRNQTAQQYYTMTKKILRNK
jgi:protein O-mannosyl-transferase